MKCERCDKTKDELFCLKVYEPVSNFYCKKCYIDEHATTNEEFINDFQTERRDQQMHERGVSQRQEMVELQQSEDVVERQGSFL